MFLQGSQLALRPPGEDVDLAESAPKRNMTPELAHDQKQTETNWCWGAYFKDTERVTLLTTKAMGGRRTFAALELNIIQ